jgi:transaldolase
MLFLDSSNPKEVAELFGWGVVDGVTTNPLIISREMPGADLGKTIREILSVSSGPVSVELTEATEQTMVEEAESYRCWCSDRICIKVPVNELGVRVISQLRWSDSFRTPFLINATCIMTTMQAVLAAEAGANYVSLFWGRIKDLQVDPGVVVRQTRELLHRYPVHPQIIVGSIRQPADVLEALVAGADIVTVPPAILRKLVHHPRTEETIREFAEAWGKQMVAQAYLPTIDDARKWLRESEHISPQSLKTLRGGERDGNGVHFEYTDSLGAIILVTYSLRYREWASCMAP